MIKKNNSELAEYINTLSKITDLNKQKLEELILDTSNMEKKLTNIPVMEQFYWLRFKHMVLPLVLKAGT